MENFYIGSAKLNHLKYNRPKKHFKAHISYPIQVLGKSCKPVAVMVLCLILGQKSYKMEKYLSVATIVAGVITFVYNPKKNTSDSGFSLGIGEMWILASLTLDGVVASCQEFMKRNYQSPKSNMMLNMNLIALFVLTGQSLYHGSLFGNLKFLHPILTEIFGPKSD